MRTGHLLSRFRSEDGQVWSWILKIFLAAAVAAIIISQAGPVIWNQISIGSLADDAADLAVLKYEQYRDLDRTTAAVDDWLKERDARRAGNITIATDQAGRPITIGVPVRRIEGTVLFEHVSYLSSLTEADAYAERSLIR